mmetsp:Transcript_5564/g.6007  ORF Transcript_5564/g.6007 Transcript_5564/m.6007 type:complete len:153 (-) Transcript_5564:62-520(-)
MALRASTGKPGSETPLIDRIDYFFSSPENTTAVGKFLQDEAACFMLFEKTDDRNGLESYALFKRYGALIESLMQRFCDEEHVSMEAIAKEIFEQMEAAEDLAPPFICVGYIAGALDIDAFADLVVDVNAITQYDVGLHDAQEPDENPDPEEA